MRRSRVATSTRCSVFALLVLCLSCQGAVTPVTPRTIDGVPRNCAEEPIEPGRAPLRRLTVSEYDATISALFGDESGPASRLVDAERGVTSADARAITERLVEQYMGAAEDVAARLTSEAALSDTLGCDVVAEGEDVCARRFVEQEAPRVYRHPVSADELDELYALYEAGRDDEGGGFAVGIQLVIEAMLQAPEFLYRVEIVPLDGEEIVRLDGYQLATRLSYFLWGTMPDPALFEAAESGALDTQEGLELQARRMLEDGRSEVAIQRFFSSYLELSHLEGLEKDPELFPDFNERIAELMRQETEAFIHEVVVEGDGSWETLLTANWSMMNRELADYYGVSGPSGEAFERVELDGAYHSGFLTHGSSMATRARPYETSPIHRGLFVRGGLICGEVPDVPEGIETELPPPTPGATIRERLAEHRENEYCASCHRQIDPLGFAFEHFDAAGRFRPDDQGTPIDATAQIVDSDIEGTVDGAPELAASLIGSADAQACFTQRWVIQAYGRGEERSDYCALDGARARFVESGFDVRELIVGLTLSDPFVRRVADQDTFLEDSP